MKKGYPVLFILILSFILTGCAGGTVTGTAGSAEADVTDAQSVTETDAETTAQDAPDTGAETAPVPEDIMSYSEEELQQIDAYLEHSAGAEVNLYKSKTDDQSLVSRTVSDICEIPQVSALDSAGYIRYTAYIAFSEDGNQSLTVKGADKTDIKVTYNELHTEKYTKKTTFKANVFYKVEIGFAYSEGMTVTVLLNGTPVTDLPVGGETM